MTRDYIHRYITNCSSGLEEFCKFLVDCVVKKEFSRSDNYGVEFKTSLRRKDTNNLYKVSKVNMCFGRYNVQQKGIRRKLWWL